MVLLLTISGFAFLPEIIDIQKSFVAMLLSNLHQVALDLDITQK
jgi:hypothetical protein